MYLVPLMCQGFFNTLQGFSLNPQHPMPCIFILQMSKTDSREAKRLDPAHRASFVNNGEDQRERELRLQMTKLRL